MCHRAPPLLLVAVLTPNGDTTGLARATPATMPSLCIAWRVWVGKWLRAAGMDVFVEGMDDGGGHGVGDTHAKAAVEGRGSSRHRCSEVAI
jgi:hypothetical protein